MQANTKPNVRSRNGAVVPSRAVSEGHARRGAARMVGLALAGALVLALAGCTITLGNSISYGSGTTIPVRVLRGSDNATLVQVPIYIGNKGPYQFILDTGASISLIDRALALRLNLPWSGSRQPVSGVGGTEQVVFVSVAQWRLDSLALPKTTIASGALPSDRGGPSIQGLLGSDLLSQFGKITLDYNAATLTVYRQIGG
jgi:hypothetical protein